MRDFCLIALALAVVLPVSLCLFGLANRISGRSRCRRPKWIIGLVGALSAAITGFGRYSPLPLMQLEDYLAVIAVGLIAAGASAGVLLVAIVDWSYRKLREIGFVDYLAQYRKRILFGSLWGMLVGLAVGTYVVMDPRQVLDLARRPSPWGQTVFVPLSPIEVALLPVYSVREWPVILVSLVGGLLGVVLGAVIHRRMCRAACGLSLLAILACIVWAVAYVPASSSLRFHRAIASADRLVVRHGGFDCCGPVDGQRILFEVVDPTQIAEIRQRLEFVRGLPGLSCSCCGYPGIDWYCGQTKVALTSVQHWEAIRWRGFKGDAHLTEESSRWLKQWLNERGVTSDSPYQY